MKDSLMDGKSAKVQFVIDSDDIKELARHIYNEVRSEFISKEEEENQNTFLTCEAVCEMLGKDRSTLWRWNRDGYLKPIKVGKTLQYRLSDVLKIKEGKR